MMGWKRRLKYGSYAVIVTLVVLAIFAVVNLIAAKQDWKIDLTKNKIYSLSDQTKQVLSKLNQDVNVYIFYKKSGEDSNITQLVDNYKKISPRIKVQYLDADRNPEKVKEYGVDTYNSVVFESMKRTRNVSYYEVYTYGDNNESVFAGEQKFTSAIKYVTSEKVPTVYMLQGHNEPGTDSLAAFTDALKSENYNVNTLDLLTQKKIPQDADILIDVAPQKGFLPEEIQELDKYFAGGGKGMFFIDPPTNEPQDISPLRAMLKKWGVEVNDDVVIEGDTNFYYQNPTLLIPEMQEHEITSELKSNNFGVLMGYVRSLTLTSQPADKNNGYNVQPLLKSSTNSWGKVNLKNTIEKEVGDLPGPRDIAAVVSKKVGDKEMRVLVFGSSNIINDQILQLGRGNKDFILNSAGWLRGTPEEITIRPKETIYGPITISSNQLFIISGIVLLLIPGIVLAMGLIVWARRRHL